MMDNKIHIGDVGTKFVVDCGVDISNAIEVKLIFRKPTGEVITVNAQKDLNDKRIIFYVNTMQDFFDVAGIYKLQSYVKFSETSVFYGNVCLFEVLSNA